MATTSKQVIIWLLGYLQHYKLRVLGAILSLIVAAACWLILGQGLKYAIDQGLLADNQANLDSGLVIIFLICLVGSGATYLRFYLMTWLGERVNADIRKHVFSHLLTLPPSFFAQQRTGEVIARFTSDTAVLQTVVGMSLSMATRSVITLCGALVLMSLTSPLLTVSVILAVPAILIPIRFLAPLVRKYARLSQDKIANLGAHIDQSLHEISTVQAYTSEQIEARWFEQRVEEAMGVGAIRIHYRALLIGCIMVLSLAAIIIVAWLGIHQVFDQRMTMGDLGAFLFYAIMAGTAVATISEVIGEIQRGVGASERLLELLNTKSAILHGNRPFTLTHAPDIGIKEISFAYPQGPRLFNNFSLNIKAGEKIALVGASGAGKSTLFQLLLRFHDVSHGSITIDNQDVRDLTLTDLRACFALVSQEPVVFADSIFENIRYGTPDAAIEQVEDAAKNAFAHEFISNLEKGYNTLVGERGVNLSGGQKQRIAIARAILSDRPILLLDEATSALDARSERMVQQALATLMKGKTSIVIAHRLATVQHADRIIVMDKGAIVSIGDHETLQRDCTIYRDFVELQLLK